MRGVFLSSLLALNFFSGCVGSPATLALRPDFELATHAGLASVSVRQAPQNMTISAFDTVVKRGMEAALTTNLEPAPSVGPFPRRRIVWHVNPIPENHDQRLVVNAFNGSVPFVYEEQTIDSAARSDTLSEIVQSMTRRLFVAIDRHDHSLRGSSDQREFAD